MIRLSANVQRVVDRGHPVLHEVAGEAADDAADQYDQRNFVAVKTNFLGESFDGERAIGVDSLIARLVRKPGGVDQRLSRIELRHDAVDRIALHSFTSASGSRVRISKIEISGNRRRNRNIAARNMPMVPMYVIQSQRVG